MSVSADVVIVGGGAAGCALGAQLATTGRAVTVLEAGPFWTLSDLISSQILSRRLKWAGAVPDQQGRNRIPYMFNAGWGVGGAALHHGGVWLRAQPSDFTLASDHGKYLDWPVAYEDLRPFYDDIQAEVGLSGDAEQEIWRPPGTSYPMPPMPLLPQSAMVKRGFDALGIRTAPLPSAVNTIKYRDRPACIYDGWCDAGCPTGALANPLVVSVSAALRAGVKFITRATVTSLRTTPKGDQVDGVRYVRPDGSCSTISASTVVLAAYAIQNSVILLNSRTAQHPNGLANSSGLVGAYLSAHPMVAMYGLFEQPTHNYLGTSGGQIFSQDGQAKVHDARAFGSYQWQVGAAMKPSDLLGIANTMPALHGARFSRFMRRAAQHLASMNAVCEGLPMRANRIELSGRATPSGAPIPRLTHTLSPESAALIDLVKREGVHIMRAAGAQSAWSSPVAFAHISGGTIMGRDPQHSVTDHFGRTHDVENLFIAGASVFPTTGAFNPTFTVYALTRRLGEHLIH